MGALIVAELWLDSASWVTWIHLKGDLILAEQSTGWLETS